MRKSAFLTIPDRGGRSCRAGKGKALLLIAAIVSTILACADGKDSSTD